MSPRRQKGTLFAIRDTCYLEYRITESKDGTCAIRQAVFVEPSRFFATHKTRLRESNICEVSAHIARSLLMLY
jgi:hypothetical protein